MKLTHTTLAVALVAALCQPAEAGDATFTLRHDMHGLGSLVVAENLTLYTGSAVEGGGISFGIGLAKELVDRLTPGHAFTCKSLLFDAAGAVLGASFAHLSLEGRGKATQLAYTGRF